MPALEELAGHGYMVKENGDEITVARPSTKKKSCQHICALNGENKYFTMGH